MSEGYLNRVRDARKRPSVLKAKVLTVRSKDSSIPILIFEGKSDIGPYTTWIRQINSHFNFAPIPGDGKGQLLEFRRLINNTQDENLQSIYFFIDNDYDGYRGHTVSNNIFCLDTYSFENYLVTERVLTEILIDEFECASQPEDIESATSLFSDVLSQFLTAMKDANFRFYLAAKLDLRRGRVEKKVSKFVSIEISRIEKAYTPGELNDLVPILEDYEETDEVSAKSEFNRIEQPQKSYRGKYLLDFFLSWLDLLAESRRNGYAPFSSGENIKFNRAILTPRSLASRSDIPNGLADYINTLSEQYQ